MATTRQGPARGRLKKIALAVILLGVLAGHAAAGDITVTDDSDRRVSLDDPAQRVVSLAPHATELLFAVGAGDQIVGTVSHSDYPAEARNIPRVGGYDAVDIERILSMQPDLVVGWASGNGEPTIERLKELDLTVFVNEPRALDDIAHSMARLGRLTGHAEGGRDAAKAFRERLASLRERYADRPEVPVFYEVWHEPLMTVSADHIISEMIAVCGGRNVFAELDARVPTVDTEAVLGADPEAVVASGMGSERPDWLDAWRDWDGLKAAEQDNLFHIPPSLTQRATPRLLDGAQQLCEKLEIARERRAEGS
jgi:iron complex transport system substrate-binding protein